MTAQDLGPTRRSRVQPPGAGLTLHLAPAPGEEPDRHEQRSQAARALRLLCQQEQLLADRPGTRESRVDTARRQEALRREADALHEHLARPLPSLPPRPTAVLVHRQPWFLAKLGTALGGRGIDVIGHTDDGATASGMAVALGPDLLLLEAQLPSMTGAELARRVTHCRPGTIVAAQVPHQEDREALLEAGAAYACTRHVLPVVVSAELAALLDLPGMVASAGAATGARAR